MTDRSSVNTWIELLEPPALPSSEDRLFSSQEDWWNNACVNWCHDGLGLYASGYKDAADVLVQHVEQRSSGQDSLVYPVLFLYRQYLELQIKDLILQGRRIKEISGDFPKHHHIGNLWEMCHKLLSEISPGESVVELREITRLIAEFSAVDPSSMAFRYPHDKDGNPSLPGITHINLRNVRDVIGKISIILMGASAQLGEYLSFKHEMESEFRSEW
ncbi:MAG: hypothetical protein K2X00_18885 [Nitrospiraceae bacterium]|jgi:hypothetical protein|nr:hypothetical protein [Nitrospiraceae bacterium]